MAFLGQIEKCLLQLLFVFVLDKTIVKKSKSEIQKFVVPNGVVLSGTIDNRNLRKKSLSRKLFINKPLYRKLLWIK